MRSINDFLYALRDGRVSCTVTILTADLDARSLVVSRNSNCPVVIGHSDGSHCLDSAETPIGVHRQNRPSITHWPLYPGTTVVGFTDGVIHAGRRTEQAFDVNQVQSFLYQGREDSQRAAEQILAHALAADNNQPKDDMVVAALAITDADKGLGIRHLQLSYPF